MDKKVLLRLITEKSKLLLLHLSITKKKERKFMDFFLFGFIQDRLINSNCYSLSQNILFLFGFKTIFFTEQILRFIFLTLRKFSPSSSICINNLNRIFFLEVFTFSYVTCKF